MPAADEDAADDNVENAEDEQPAQNHPLEAIRRAQARRVAPPGTQPHIGGGKGRGANPKAPRHYNRHK